MSPFEVQVFNYTINDYGCYIFDSNEEMTFDNYEEAEIYFNNLLKLYNVNATKNIIHKNETKGKNRKYVAKYNDPKHNWHEIRIHLLDYTNLI